VRGFDLAVATKYMTVDDDNDDAVAHNSFLPYMTIRAVDTGAEIPLD
jgi:hypothetical protein